ncbi:MAG: VTT domain-containing protein [Candidatus Pacebacteria bacterium]|nr:VTT domain-containing protein [Candidatus Paceibacterota bacterium]
MDIPFLNATLPELIQGVGYLGVFLIVFIESGVPIGMVLPLPGDTLLFSAGLLAASNAFDLVPLIITIVVAAILGDSAGYWFGSHYGPKLFTKEDALFMNKRHLDRAERFYTKYGGLALILARFLPLLRTLVPIAAGMGRMSYSAFLRFNVIGAFLWGISVTLLGYYLGTLIPDVDKYLLPILGVIVLISVLVSAREIWNAKKELNARQ